MDGPQTIDIVTLAILMVIYGAIIHLGAKYNSFTVMFYGFVCIIAVNINTFLVEYPIARSAARVIIALVILGLITRGLKLMTERISNLEQRRTNDKA